MKRKLMTVLISLTIISSLSACGNTKESTSAETTAASVEVEQQTQAETIIEEETKTIEESSEEETVTEEIQSETATSEEIETTVEQAETQQSSLVINELMLWNHTSSNWSDLYFQTEENGEWIKTSWDFGSNGNICGGDAPIEENVELKSSYFAIKAVTEGGEEKVWTLNLIVGENRDYIEGEQTYTVEADGSWLQLDLLEEGRAAISWN